MEEFLQKLERYHFINYKVGSQKVSFIEKTFGSYSEKISAASNEEDLKDLLQELFSKLRKDLITKEEFLGKFTLIKYDDRKEQKRFIRYIFQNFNTSRTGTNENADKAIFDFDETTNPPSIEHWAPDRYTEGDEYQDIWDQLEKEDKNSIGNLLVLNHVSNSRLGNDSPQVKFQTIKQWMKDNKVRNYGFVEQFLKTYEDDFTHWGQTIYKKEHET